MLETSGLQGVYQEKLHVWSGAGSRERLCVELEVVAGNNPSLLERRDPILLPVAGDCRNSVFALLDFGLAPSAHALLFSIWNGDFFYF